MITLVVGGLVSSGAFMFFVGQRRVYSTQAKILNVQQNLWGAMDTLTRFVRAAGTGMVGCVRAGDPAPGSAVAPQTGVRIYQKGPPATVTRLAPLWILNGAAGAPDKITIALVPASAPSSIPACRPRWPPPPTGCRRRPARARCFARTTSPC
jgi:Tfp pilus assembly protein PilW